jgi:hypothetical protein
VMLASGANDAWSSVIPPKPPHHGLVARSRGIGLATWT